jgi:hypothetical protein
VILIKDQIGLPVNGPLVDLMKVHVNEKNLTPGINGHIIINLINFFLKKLSHPLVRQRVAWPPPLAPWGWPGHSHLAGWGWLERGG